MPNVGAQLWSSAYLPSIYQGTYVPCNESDPEKMIQHLVNRRVSPSEQRRELELVNAFNKLDMDRREHDAMLEGRIQSMEVAFRMQTEALEAFDISKESEATRTRYGITAPTALQPLPSSDRLHGMETSPAAVFWRAGWWNTVSGWCRSTLARIFRGIAIMTFWCTGSWLSRRTSRSLP